MIRPLKFFSIFIVLIFYSCGPIIADLSYAEINAECIDFNSWFSYHFSPNNSHPDEIAASRLCIAVTPKDLYSYNGCDFSKEPIHPLSVPVNDIRIFTIYDLSEDYPAGSMVNTAFGLVDAMNFYDPIPWPDKGEKDAFITHAYFDPVPFIFAIRVPAKPGAAQFRVEFELSNGRVLSSLTPEVTLN